MWTHYLRQLQHLQLAFRVKQKRPRIVDEVVSTTLKMESYLLPKACVAQVTDELVSWEPVSAVWDQQDAMMTLLQQFVQWMDQLESQLAALQAGHPLSSPSVELQNPSWTETGPVHSSLVQEGRASDLSMCGHLPPTRMHQLSRKQEALSVTGQTPEGLTKANPSLIPRPLSH